jgi:hypothetical protein
VQSAARTNRPPHFFGAERVPKFFIRLTTPQTLHRPRFSQTAGIAIDPQASSPQIQVIIRFKPYIAAHSETSKPKQQMMVIKIGAEASDVVLEDGRLSGLGTDRRFIRITPLPLQ